MADPIRCFEVVRDSDGLWHRKDDPSVKLPSPQQFGDGACWKNGSLVKIMLPRTGLFCPQRNLADGKPWECSGEIPNITVNPSVNDPGVWHGWIKDGIITEC